MIKKKNMHDRNLFFVTKNSKSGGESIFINKIVPFLNKENFLIRTLSISNGNNSNNEICLNSKLFMNEVIPSIRDYNIIKKEMNNDGLIINYIFGLQSLYYFFACFSKNKKIISTFHTNIIGKFNIKYPYDLLSKFIIVNLLTLFSKKMIFITESQMNEFKFLCLFKNKFNSKSIFIYNFIEKSNILKNKDFKDRDLTLSFVGRLKKSKGFYDLIKVINKIDNKDIKFKIIGEGPLKEKVPQKDSIQVIGEISNQKVIEQLDKSQIFILPSYSETFGLVILEAMARGLVVLASDLPAIRDYFIDGRNGYLFPPGDVEKMKELILYLKNNPQEIERISKNNLKDIWKFTAEKQVPKYIKVYKEVLKESKKKNKKC
ncbi:MAG: glycosyltransferase family 4 protein [Candidatus Pacearchaeota archaeon]